MDWIAIIFLAFFISIGLAVLTAIGIVYYRILFRPIIGKMRDPADEEKREREEKEEANKEYHWIYYLMAVVSIAIGLWRYSMINEAMFSAIMLPAMFGSWFIIRFRHKAERTGIRFRDILLHPWRNFSLFLFFCTMIIICILFIVPMLISVYG